MDELNINNLPAEILTEVFRYLNEGNLRNATMVCKLWNNLIESAVRWSLELEHDKNGRLCSKSPESAKHKMNFILTTNRKIGTIKIHGHCLNEDLQIVETFKRHGFNVVELHLYMCRMNSLSEFAELLNFTPNLQHVVADLPISHFSIDEFLMDQLLPDFKKLKSLEFCVSDFKIIKCFRKAKLTTIEIYEDVPSQHLSLLVDFLSTQDKLTTLAVDSYSSSILVEMGKPSVSIPFRLTQLSISGIARQEQSQNYGNFVKFIESQAGNLTEIQMDYGIPMSVYEYVFANMTKLTTLWMRTSHIPHDNDFYDRLKENYNVHTVRLLGIGLLECDLFVGKFLQKLPNIRCLFLMNAQRSLKRNILVMAQSLSKLESLHIESIHETSLDNVKFPNLKTLHIQRLRGKIDWNEFSKAHPLLTELTMEQMDNCLHLTSDDIDQITTNVDLQHIRFGAGFVADNRFFEIVGSKCKNLKVLDLHKSCISQNLRHYTKIDVLRLRDSITFPNVFGHRMFK